MRDPSGPRAEICREIQIPNMLSYDDIEVQAIIHGLIGERGKKVWIQPQIVATCALRVEAWTAAASALSEQKGAAVAATPDGAVSVVESTEVGQRDQTHWAKTLGLEIVDCRDCSLGTPYGVNRDIIRCTEYRLALSTYFSTLALRAMAEP